VQVPAHECRAPFALCVCGLFSWAVRRENPFAGSTIFDHPRFRQSVHAGDKLEQFQM
jgi:hypothetical protein